MADLPYADHSFDKILSIHTLYFWTDPEQAIAEIARVLKPGGRLALTLSPGKVGTPDDAGYRTMVEGYVLPSMTRHGFATARVACGSGTTPPSPRRPELGYTVAEAWLLFSTSAAIYAGI